MASWVLKHSKNAATGRLDPFFNALEVCSDGPNHPRNVSSGQLSGVIMALQGA
jgi:hypothetical protein